MKPKPAQGFKRKGWPRTCVVCGKCALLHICFVSGVEPMREGRWEMTSLCANASNRWEEQIWRYVSLTHTVVINKRWIGSGSQVPYKFPVGWILRSYAESGVLLRVASIGYSKKVMTSLDTDIFTTTFVSSTKWVLRLFSLRRLVFRLQPFSLNKSGFIYAFEAIEAKKIIITKYSPKRLIKQ